MTGVPTVAQVAQIAEILNKHIPNTDGVLWDYVHQDTGEHEPVTIAHVAAVLASTVLQPLTEELDATEESRVMWLKAYSDLRAGVTALAEKWAYKGEFGWWGTWQAGEGPDIEGQVLDSAASALRELLKGNGA